MARARAVVDDLKAGDRAKQLRAVKDVRNSIIGSKSKKLAYIKLGAVPKILELLAADSHDQTELQLQCAACAGSFAYQLEAGVSALIEAEGLQLLNGMLSSSDAAVVKASMRSLKSIYMVSHRKLDYDACSQNEAYPFSMYAWADGGMQLAVMWYAAKSMSKRMLWHLCF